MLGIVIDQFRYDYVTRFREDYTGGFARLLRDGAVFTNARYDHFPTVTAVGHSTFMSGATPNLSGIIGNEWFDRESGKQVTSVSDPAVQLLGAGRAQAGASPRKLLSSTVGDELKIAGRNKPRVIGISLKDRAAILPAGHSADGAYWFDPQSGNFVSSTFYFPDLPQWVKDHDAARPADKFAGAEWRPLAPSPDYTPFDVKIAAAPGPRFYTAIESSPYANEMIESFAERAIESEGLGQRGVTDLLTVSFSANDYVGHEKGPDAPEVRDMAIRVDRTIGKLLDYVDRKLGAGSVLVVFTGDHGVAPLPEANAARHMPGGRLSGKAIMEAIEQELSARFGEGKWISGYTGASSYLNRELIRAKKLDEAVVERAAADAVARMPHIFRVYTRTELLAGAFPMDGVARKVVNGFYPPRAADITIVEDPYWIQAATGATHGSPFGYDSHVPVMFMGPGIKPGRYDANIMPNDIAPTLATMLDVETPSGSVGRVLTEMLVAP